MRGICVGSLAVLVSWCGVHDCFCLPCVFCGAVNADLTAEHYVISGFGCSVRIAGSARQMCSYSEVVCVAAQQRRTHGIHAILSCISSMRRSLNDAGLTFKHFEGSAVLFRLFASPLVENVFSHGGLFLL